MEYLHLRRDLAMLFLLEGHIPGLWELSCCGADQFSFRSSLNERCSEPSRR